MLSISLQILVFLCYTKYCCSYRFAIDLGDQKYLCPIGNETCSDGSQHYLCKNYTIAKECRNFHLIQFDNRLRSRFLQGHNGIRNKVAENFGIGNMNLVHWSRELALMAAYFLKQCKIAKDRCLNIGQKSVPVNQNYFFRELNLNARWSGYVIRKWYLELGPKISTWHDFKMKLHYGLHDMENFTQMIWPKTEFIGCSAARMFHGYLVVCYYEPPFDKNLMHEAFKIGPPCTHCTKQRPTCSRTFASLCGLDFELDIASTMCLNKWLILFVLITYYILIL